MKILVIHGFRLSLETPALVPGEHEVEYCDYLEAMRHEGRCRFLDDLQELEATAAEQVEEPKAKRTRRTKAEMEAARATAEQPAE